MTLAQAELMEAAGRARQRDTLADEVDRLPFEQRELYDAAGGLEGLLHQYRATDTARAFLTAGGALTESEQIGQEPAPGKRTISQAVHSPNWRR
ncbi:hypothetical protein [Phaeovulum sp.]|uniref:hypothetical protein n=1 Tax=Phaeovulum sp. TaxID=2934796 RepID=UPI0039E6A615